MNNYVNNNCYLCSQNRPYGLVRLRLLLFFYMMKTIKILAAAAILFSVAACNTNKSAVKSNGVDSTAVAQSVTGVTENPKALLPSKSEVDSVSYLLGIQLGAMIKGYNLGDMSYAQIKKGINDFVHSTGNQRDTDFVKQFKVNPEDMNRIMSSFIDKRRAYTSSVNKEKETKFFADNKAKAGVQSTESGLQYIIKEAGNDVKPGAKDTVYVHYKLSIPDGTVIEEVAEKDPAVMFLNNRLVRGWTEGIAFIGEGGKETLYIPSELGYGDRGNQAIEPNTTLIFDIQLDSVKRFVEPVEETPATPVKK